MRTVADESSAAGGASVLERLMQRHYARRLAHVHCLRDFRALARRRLPRMMYDYIEGGAGQELAVAANRAAIERVRLLPSAPANVATCDLSCTLFGRRMDMPAIIGPTGLASGSWPGGELALARAARDAGIPFVLSNHASHSPESVAEAAGGGAWFQLYPPRDMQTARDWLARLEACGYRTLEVTVDVAVPGLRLRDARNGFAMPFRWTPAKFLDVARRPGWALTMLLRGAPVPYLHAGEPARAKPAANQSEMRRNRLSRDIGWDSMQMLRDLWKGELIIKGVTDPEQAARAAGAGYDGIVVSNHGGRQLDGAVAPMEMLPEIRDAVGPRFPLLIDGGFESGVDITKALAMGADAVQLGRATVYALAAAGEAGVALALRMLREELDNTFALCGVRSAGELTPARVRCREGAPRAVSPGSARGRGRGA